MSKTLFGFIRHIDPVDVAAPILREASVEIFVVAKPW